MNWITRNQAEDLAALQSIVADLGAELVVVGATALRAAVPDLPRFTEDIDVVVSLDMDSLVGAEPSLAACGWSRDVVQEQRWRGPHGSRIDLIPAGPTLRSARQVTWPRSGMTMSLVGFDHVFERAMELEVLGHLSVRVVMAEVLFLLKVVAYLDDPERRVQDLGDIHGLLRRYEYNSERMYSDLILDAGLADADFVPAFLLGWDLATICDVEECGLVQRFIDKCADRSSREFALMLQHETMPDQPQDWLAHRIAALHTGFNARSDAQ